MLIEICPLCQIYLILVSLFIQGDDDIGSRPPVGEQRQFVKGKSRKVVNGMTDSSDRFETLSCVHSPHAQEH